MKKIKNFCGIFDTVFVTTTMVLLASCSQDDDYYDSDMYTLAEMGTRLVGDGEDTSPAFSKIADMDSVLIDFKNMMGHTVNSTKVRLYILATNDMTQFGARAELNPRDGDFRTASVKLLDDDSLNYTFKVTINILDRYENKQKGIIELPCPKSSFF